MEPKSCTILSSGNWTLHNLLERQINATPIGVRTKGKRGDTDNRSFLAEVVTPAELAGELGRSPALGTITLPTQVEDYLLQKS